ncbi:MAG: aminotransferase class I/II-fold pyridoxal phosphate-dependent enzyme [Solirubrobacteraceae bacterium]|nr:aminotransferase class I/II-fold pyridoxal phosphate-dependent enzyme [Patulibacter sp.]
MSASRRSAVPPFAVMEVLNAVAERRAAGLDVFALCAGEPSGGAPADVRAAAADLLRTNGRIGYTETLGLPALRAELAAHYGRWYGVDPDPARIAITTGSSGAFVLAFLAAFDAGDRVALARPGYPAYRNILASLGCEVVEIDCGAEQGWILTPEQLEAASAAGPLAGVVVASPANPTGTMVDDAQMAALASWTSAHGARLVSDEIYHGITFGPSRGATALAHGTDAVVVSSFSKYWGMTGWRLGWTVLPEDLVGPVDALGGNMALSAPALSQHAAIAAFTDQSYLEADAAVEQYRAHRELVLPRLARLGFGDVAPVDGGFCLYADITAELRRAGETTSVTWCKRLLDDTGVALTPGTDFDPAGGATTVRLAFAAATDVITEGLDRLEAWIAR